MTRIGGNNPEDQDVLRKTKVRHPFCNTHRDLAKIWVKLGQVKSLEATKLFLCDRCTFEFKLILMTDIGYQERIVQTPAKGYQRQK